MVQESILKQFEVGDLIHLTSSPGNTDFYTVLRRSSDGELYEVLRQKDSCVYTICGYRVNFYEKIEE